MTSTATESYIFAFGWGRSDGDPERKDLLGGKGASLAAMSRAGLPVPGGFTISAECCPFVERLGRWPDGLAEKVRDAMHRLERDSGRTFGRGGKPLLVAVRSGAAVSMPGMMDTILNCGLNLALADSFADRNKFWSDYADHIRMFAKSVANVSLDSSVKGQPEALARSLLADYERAAGKPFPQDPWDALTQSIDAVFASWRSERAVAYRKHHDIQNVTGTAVNVQMMFPSQRAGVLFTANPNRLDAGEMVLEASWGLGEVVVSGAVTPDIYVLDAATLTVKNSTAGDRPGDEPALDGQQIERIGQLGQKVEQYFKVPCDIEWGLADGELVLLQSRPIRGLDVLRDVEVGRQEEIARLRKLARGARRVWVIHNLDETLPGPTPMTWDIVRRFMSGDGGFGLMYRDFGYEPGPEVRRDGFLELICGRIYVDPVRNAALFWDRVPMEYSTADILEDPSVLERAPNKFNSEKAGPDFFFRLPVWIYKVLRASRRTSAARRVALDRFKNVALPKLEAFLAGARATDLGKLSTADLLAELDRRREYVMGEFAAESLKPGFFGGMAQGRVLTLLAQLMGDSEGENLARRLTMGLENDSTVEQNVMLFNVARSQASMDDFIARFGHRATGEMELAQPRWREDRSYLERMVENLKAPGATSPEARHREQVANRIEAQKSLMCTLAEHGGSSLYEEISRELADAQAMLPYRETGKHYLMMGYETVRLALVELGRRWNIGRDVFFLQLDELAGYESRDEQMAPTVAARKIRWEAMKKLSPANVIDSADLDNLGRFVLPAGDATTLPARPIASGTATGTARLVFDPAAAGDLGPDYILVCPSTDPGWTPLFVNARGLVVERGGVLSHGAIVARDFGIPAVVCENATKLIPDKTRITVDGTRGAIVKME